MRCFLLYKNFFDLNLKLSRNFTPEILQISLIVLSTGYLGRAKMRNIFVSGMGQKKKDFISFGFMNEPSNAITRD